MKKLFCILVTFLSISVLGKEKLSLEAKNLMLKVLEKNESLHHSFFSYNAKAVEDATKELLKFSITNKEKALDSDLLKVRESLEKISAKQTQEENKKQYGLANIYFVKIINKYDLGEKYQAYYCPMVRKKWVQNTQKGVDVQNPYDASMPDCGGRL